MKFKTFLRAYNKKFYNRRCKDLYDVKIVSGDDFYSDKEGYITWFDDLPVAEYKGKDGKYHRQYSGFLTHKEVRYYDSICDRLYDRNILDIEIRDDVGRIEMVVEHNENDPDIYGQLLPENNSIE
jgi:hypothetical protein